MQPFDKRKLLPGDVLLHSSPSAISKLIEWAGDSAYSHAAIVYDATSLREASAAGVRTYDLATRLADTTDYAFIDAYRRAEEPAGLKDIEVAAVRKVADGYMGTPYPLSELGLLGLACALRDKIPLSDQLRLYLRWIIDACFDHTPNFQVCSETVYRCYSEAKVAPSLQPRIIISPLLDIPFPDINLKELIEEIIHAWEQANPGTAALMPMARVSEDELLAHYARVRAKLGAGPVVDPDPNPRTILPRDLQDSPDFALLGRVTGEC
jgi:hypothetical protein